VRRVLLSCPNYTFLTCSARNIANAVRTLKVPQEGYAQKKEKDEGRLHVVDADSSASFDISKIEQRIRNLSLSSSTLTPVKPAQSGNDNSEWVSELGTPLAGF
jgi:hypothetical protein